MTDTINIDNIAIVLNRPRYPENIGAAARAMCNMGLHRLVVVKPENCDLTRVLKMATHAAADVVEQMDLFDDLKEALAPFHYIVGTTARLGGQRQVVSSPKETAETVVPMTRTNRVAILFGPEDRGLTNEDIRLCHSLVNIPTAAFASLNLAQAVMIVCYEIHSIGRTTHTPLTPRLAARHELEGMYDQLKEILIRIDFVNRENPDYWMTNLRRFFDRLPLRAKEVRVIRGVCRQIDWYSKKCYQDGKEGIEQ